jgi:hypothetical protein
MSFVIDIHFAMISKSAAIITTVEPARTLLSALGTAFISDTPPLVFAAIITNNLHSLVYLHGIVPVQATTVGAEFFRSLPPGH